MRQMTIALLAITSIAASADLASAGDDCGIGRCWNGLRCAQIGQRIQFPDAYWSYYSGYPYQRRWYYGCTPHHTVRGGLCMPYPHREY